MENIDKVKNIGVVLAGGNGTRFNSGMPKQYHEVCGKLLIEYSVSALCNCASIDLVVVVANIPEGLDVTKLNKYNAHWIQMSGTRNESVAAAMSYVETHCKMCKKIIFHDSVRPITNEIHIQECLDMLDGYDAVFASPDITDSLGSKKGAYVNREEYFLIQTPEAFKYEVFKKIFDVQSEATSLVHQLPLNYTRARYKAIKNNYKVTYPEDIKIVTALLKED